MRRKRNQHQFANKTQASTTEINTDFRCAWVADNRRCRYFGTINLSVRSTEPWFCTQHALLHDPVRGAQIVEESYRDIPEDYDYSSNAAVARARAAYLARPV